MNSFTMRKYRSLTAILFILLALQHILCASILLTDEERSYIATRAPVRAVSVDGAAPIQYTDSKGVIRGISIQVLGEISKRTGLSFEYKLHEKLTQAGVAYSDGTEILFGIPDQYARPGYQVSKPFLRTQTILFANKKANSQALENMRFAATYTSALPEGITEEQSIYYQSREEAIKAVNAGEADFGYGNAYSVAFYTLRHGFQNIYTVPQGKEERLYRILYIKDDPLLISIMEKALSSFTTEELQAFTLEATSQVERVITPMMILDTYRSQVLLIALAIIAILLGSLVFVHRSRTNLNLEKMKFRAIAEVSNEYLFEYDTQEQTLVPYEKLKTLLATPEALKLARKTILSFLAEQPSDDESPILELELKGGERGFFRLSASKVARQKGRGETWIGKLQDISEEVEKLNHLEDLAQTDGLTGLLNATTTRLRIVQRLNAKKPSGIDFCILFDLDDFKTVNDTNGHLAGDRVLKSVGNILLQSNRSKDDIIGRVGGDEFCIYLVAIGTEEAAFSYCTSLLERVRFKLHAEGVTISM